MNLKSFNLKSNNTFVGRFITLWFCNCLTGKIARYLCKRKRIDSVDCMCAHGQVQFMLIPSDVHCSMLMLSLFSKRFYSNSTKLLLRTLHAKLLLMISNTQHQRIPIGKWEKFTEYDDI